MNLRIFLRFSLILCILRFPLSAQTIQQIPRFSFSATSVGLDQPPELYWLDLTVDAYGREIREPKLLNISNGSRGASVEIPTRPPVQLYRKVRTEDGSEDFLPALEIPEPAEKGKLLLLLFRQPDGSPAMKFFDDSPAAHPPCTVRFINVSAGRAVAAIGAQPVIIGPGEVKLLGKPQLDERRRFPFDVVANIQGKPSYREPTKLLRLRSEEHRLLVLFTYLPEYQNNAQDVPVLTGYTPIAYRLYDRIRLPDPNVQETEEE